MGSSNPARIPSFLNKSNENQFNPTAMKRVFKSINDDEEDGPLQIKYKSLELEWESIKVSISRSNRRSSTTIAGDLRLLHLYEDTPAKEYFPNSGHHDQAAGEVIEEPEVDFDDGILRGRRLFEESEVGSDDNGGIHGECFDLDEESEVSTEFSGKGFENCDENYDQFGGLRRSCRDSLPSDAVERGGKVVAVKGGGGGSGGSVGRLISCVVIVLFAVAIVAFECTSEHEHILVPT